MAKKVILGSDFGKDAFKAKVNENFTELYNFIGTLTSLSTEDKTNLVAAINELGESINNLDAEVDTHLLDAVTDANGAHGLKYEIGTFTPVYECLSGAFATLNYSTQVGRYTRIGRLVYFDLNIATSNVVLGTAGGSLIIGGLPFVQGTTLGAGAFATALKLFNLLADDIVRFLVSSNKISIYLDKPNGNIVTATPLSLKTGAIAYSNDVRLSGFYTL